MSLIRLRLGLERRQVGTSIKLFSLVENSIAVVTWWYLARDEVYFVLYAVYSGHTLCTLFYQKTPSSCLEEAAGILRAGRDCSFLFGRSTQYRNSERSPGPMITLRARCDSRLWNRLPSRTAASYQDISHVSLCNCTCRGRRCTRQRISCPSTQYNCV